MLQEGSGNFYGTIDDYPTYIGAVVFQLSAETNFSIFATPSGNNPFSDYLLPASDGSLYGLSQQGGTNLLVVDQYSQTVGCGSIYRISTNGTVQILFSFNGTNGNTTSGPLIQGTDGNIYGAAGTGGIGFVPGGYKSAYPSGAGCGLGTIFQWNPNTSTFTTLFEFNGTNGATPQNCGLFQAADGSFYGTTSYGGIGYDPSMPPYTNGSGTIYKITRNGTFTSLYQFTGGNDGGSPIGSLVQAADGNLYGVTALGGSNNLGTIFRISPGGAFTSVVSFVGANGADPSFTRKLVIGPDGNLYGTTASGGANNLGTIFQLKLPLTLNVNGNIAATGLYGNGGGLTGLNPANLGVGTAGINISGNAATATTTSNFTGSVADSQLSTNVAFLNGTNHFSGGNSFAAVLMATNTSNVISGTFSGDGSGLSNLNASLLTVGTIPLADLPAGLVTNDTSGNDNIFLGLGAGSNIAGVNNIDIGNPGQTGDSNTIRIGSSQTATYIAGTIYGAGGANVSIGGTTASVAGTTISSINGNYFAGPGAAQGAINYNNSGSNNTAVGNEALSGTEYYPGHFYNGNAYGSYYYPAAGSYNTAVGNSALSSTTTGCSQNTAVGYQALAQDGVLQTVDAGAFFGSYNTACGYQALYENVNGWGNTASGYQSLYNSQSIPELYYWYYPVYNEYSFQYEDVYQSAANTADGYQALFNNIGGYGNTAWGYQAMYNVSNSLTRTSYFYGSYPDEWYEDGWTGNTSEYNTACGYAAMLNPSNTVGSGSAAYGAFSLYNGGDSCTAIGYQALYNSLNANNNIALGHQAGYNIVSGGGNIDIGNTGVSNDVNIIRIGSGQSATYLASASFISGGNSQSTNNGNFVWSDSTGILTQPTNDNSVTFRATGGYRLFTGTNATDGAILKPNATSWSSLSDRNAKKNIEPVNTVAILEKLAAVPICQWHYKWESDSDVPNIGPMAQDFKHAFYPGRDDKSIATLEFDGVELAAIQGLNRKLEERTKTMEKELAGKDAELAKMQSKIGDLESQMQEIRKEMSRLSH